jgi:PAT family beta-lactamase induction signal transducer AmpG
MALCDHRFTATQYALLSALAAFGRVYVGPSPDSRRIRAAGARLAGVLLTHVPCRSARLALLAWKRPAIEALDRR